MRNITPLAVAACLTAARCTPKTVETSSAPAPTGQEAAAEMERAPSPAFNVSMTVMRNEPADTIEIAPRAAWPVLREAYRSVGLQVFAVDSASQSVASPMLRIHQFVGGQSLARYLECGHTAFGDVAATQEITMRVRSTIEPGSEGTTILRTAVRAVATPQGNDRFSCASTRGLERKIAAYIRQHSTGGGSP